VRRRKWLGLDIGSTYIKCVEVTVKRRSVVVTAVGKIQTPPRLIQRGALTDRARAEETIKEMLERSGVSAKQTILGLSTSEVLVRRHQMPALSRQELRQALEFELTDLVNFSFESAKDVSYSYEVLYEDGNEMELLFVACRRNLIDSYLQCLRNSDLEPAVIDLQAFNWPRIPLDKRRVCFVDLGSHHITVYVELDGVYKVYRVLPIGSYHFTRGIVAAFECEEAQAVRLQMTRDLDYLLTEGTGEKSTLRSVLQQFIAGILQTLDFVRAEERAVHIRDVLDLVYLVGGAAHLKGLAPILAQDIELAVEILNPFKNVTVSADVAVPDDFGSYASALALALRGAQQ